MCGFGVTMYCATKFAQEGLGEGLAQELAPFGIQSDPGRAGDHQDDALVARTAARPRARSDPASPYHGLFWASEAIADKIVERSPTRPEDVARAITAGADAPSSRACATSSVAGRRS